MEVFRLNRIRQFSPIGVGGFTLIELLVVLAIVAILSVVVILTLNPAELLKQARDSNRLSDLGTMKSAISLYLADVSPATLAPSYATCYTSATGTIGANCASTFTSAYTLSTGSSTQRGVNGSGWIPVNFTSISSGAPLGNLPIDPLNTATNFYAYGATTTNNGFKIVTVLESTKYGGASGLGSTDGGASSTAYESGTNLNL